MRRRRANGFTLVEILLALALAAAVLVALNVFVFSMGELWGRGGDVRLFDRHVRAVTRFLDDTLRQTALPPEGKFGTSPVLPQDITTASGATETLLTFTLPAGSRVLPWTGPPLPEVVCSLDVRPGTGLVLLWHSQLEKNFADTPPRETVLSPLVTGVSYDYYDSTLQQWTNDTTLQKDASGNWIAPARLRLKFAYGKLTQTAVIPLPQVSEALPFF